MSLLLQDQSILPETGADNESVKFLYENLFYQTIQRIGICDSLSKEIQNYLIV